MSALEFDVLFRRPRFPVVGYADERLFSASNLNALASILVYFDRSTDQDLVTLVDSTGEEFWYSREQCVLSPGFSGKRWTKMRIIDLYNGHVRRDRRCSVRSLSNKRLSEIVSEISALIRSL